MKKGGMHHMIDAVSDHKDALGPSSRESPAGAKKPRPALTSIRLLRVHQWIKNVLVFLPALAAHRLLEPAVAIACLHAFLVFSLCASSVYVLNDCLDYESDRLHPRKKNRPIAAGMVPLRIGWFLVVALAVVSLVGGLMLSQSVAFWLIIYVFLNIAYSYYVKKTIIADIVVLTGFYLLRLMVGSAATGIVISPWLMAFCFAVFFSLSACKRYAELVALADGESLKKRRRSYHTHDAATIHMIGVAAAFSAVIILGLYIDSPMAKELYRRPELLWLCCPLILYWLLRLWIIAGRGELVDDPLVVATRDWRAWVMVIGMGFVTFLAT
jgi:4-hydroxybenzoate polyprenyltransferase